jgi:tetratricopeptide (TPR) repeat protein
MDYYDLMLRLIRLSLLSAIVCALTANAQAPDSKASASANSALDSTLFFQLLMGELNARGADPGAGYSLILDAARKTKDARLYQRAVDIALQARSGDSALQAVRAWKQAIPASKEANRYLLQILIGLNRIGETLEPLKLEIAGANPTDRAAAISIIPRYFSRASDKKLAATLVEQALTSYLTDPKLGAAAWTTVGRMRLEAGDINSAAQAARKAQDLDANAEGPALLALSLASQSAPLAQAIMGRYLQGKPQPEIRMAYARVLLDAQRYAEAAAQILIITTEKPDYLEAWLLRGALELQDGQPEAAETSFKRYVELATAKGNDPTNTEPGNGLTQAYFSLSQIAEQRNDLTAADAWLQRISRADDLLNAQMRRAGILVRQGKVGEARDLIRNQPARSPADVRLKIMTEAQVLRENKQFTAAYDLLSAAAAKSPEDLDLAYDLAMLTEKLDKFDEMERLLRQIIASKPGYHHAYNALGYSLAERGVRLPEARLLVLKALELAPGDPFITDSLGWVEFRSGNLEDARRILQGAFDAKPDAEIAAHLGEVLWSLGQRDQAVEIWKQGTKLNSKNETLLETLKRLRVTL